MSSLHRITQTRKSRGSDQMARHTNERAPSGYDTKSSARSESIDLGLAVLCTIVQPGECVPHRAIAAATGLSHGGSFAIEQRALFKLRRALKYTSARGLGREVDAA